MAEAHPIGYNTPQHLNIIISNLASCYKSLKHKQYITLAST